MINLILFLLFMSLVSLFAYYMFKFKKEQNLKTVRKIKNMTMILTVCCALLSLDYMVNGSWFFIVWIFNGSIWLWNKHIWNKMEKSLIEKLSYEFELKPEKEKKVIMRRKKLRRIFSTKK